MSLAGSDTPLAGTLREDGDALESSRRLGVVLEKRALGPMVDLRLRVPGWTPARPGQFVMLQAEHSVCFLGRALSVSDQSGEVVSLLVAPVGVGTQELCAVPEGERVWVLGPLGNGFDVQRIASGTRRIVLVGGGVGIAPFPLLVKELVKSLRVSAQKNKSARSDAGPDVLVLAGFRDSEQSLSCAPLVDSVSQAEAGGLSCSYEAVLEEQSAGPSERATDLLQRNLRSGDHVVVCGPEAMAKAVWDICGAVPEVEVWFSLETNMACGVGSCHGCVVTLADGSYTRVCREGPVFAGADVFGGGVG